MPQVLKTPGSVYEIYMQIKHLTLRLSSQQEWLSYDRYLELSAVVGSLMRKFTK